MSGLFRILLLLSVSPVAYAAELVLSSGEEQKVLMELYTSEGCSSCPPMERYLNSFKSHDALWKTYIPVAFHVDYWNYIGWEDRYASPEFAKRQRRHAREGNVSSVYTPALIVNGRGWRPGVFTQQPRANGRSSGILDVRVGDTVLMADFKPVTGEARDFTLHIALLGMDLASKVTAGENSGRQLQHEFVVIGYTSLPGVEGHWQTRLPESHYPASTPRALAVWVTDADSLRPLQAVGGYFIDAAQ